MILAELPEAVRQVWGTEIAQECTAWLTEQLSVVGLDPDIQIPASVARRKVNTLVLRRVSNLLLADELQLKKGESSAWVWHVPVDLTFPTHRRVGCVGVVEVDARYGEVRYTETLLEKIRDQSEKLSDSNTEVVYFT